MTQHTPEAPAETERIAAGPASAGTRASSRARMQLGPCRLLVSCVSVPGQAENCPQDAIRAGGRAGGQRSASVSVSAWEPMVYARDRRGPPFTLSPRSRGQRTKFAAIVFARSAVRHHA